MSKDNENAHYTLLRKVTCLLLLIDGEDYAKDVKWFAGSKDEEAGSARKDACCPRLRT